MLSNIDVNADNLKRNRCKNDDNPTKNWVILILFFQITTSIIH